jgi:hypothetical protein
VLSVKQDDSADEMYGGEEISREFVVARCDGSEMLDRVEEPFNQITFVIECEIATALDEPVDLGRMTGLIPRCSRVRINRSAS